MTIKDKKPQTIPQMLLIFNFSRKKMAATTLDIINPPPSDSVNNTTDGMVAAAMVELWLIANNAMDRAIQ